MILFLLLLLPLQTLALQMCLNITDRNVSIDVVNATVVDRWHGYVQCKEGSFRCVFQCENINITQVCGRNCCLEVDVKKLPDVTIYTMTDGKGNCTLHLCNETIILRLLDSLNGQGCPQKEMMKLIYIRNSCPHLFNDNLEIKTTFIHVERRILHNIMRTTQVTSGGPKKYDLKVMSLNVLHINETDLDKETDNMIQIQVPQVLPQNESFVPEVWLPVEALGSIPENSVGLVSYIHSSQFQFKEEIISSMVIRIEFLKDHRLQNLRHPIKMIFKDFPEMDNKSGFVKKCSFFDEHNMTGDPDITWHDDGCVSKYTSDSVTCFCDHTTPFAVLLIREPISGPHWEILSYISYIGCGLSAFFTALSIVIYVFSRNHKMDHSISIHVSLSVALFLLNTAFLLTEWGATLGSDGVCMFIAAFMHYSLLSCFSWMAIEALHLYLLLIKVFNTHYKHYLLKLSLAGWGIPGVIVAVSLAVKDFKQFYGLTELTMTNINQTNAICWITDDSFFYSVNLSYFTLIFVFNSGILVAVASSICKMKQVFRSNLKKDPQRFTESCKSGLTVLGLTCLMGTTWGLAFLGSGYTNYPILYLFCILNSTQGFFIFLWICLSAKKQRKRAMEDRLTSTPAKTTGTKCD